ncbi:MAG: TonB-dependent receptor [Bacteroidota bacterium]|nr:TonB-dependent receptor [Bacteroidota bacterium]
MKNLFSLLILTLLTTNLFAQIPGNTKASIPDPASSGVLKGKIIDASSNQPMEYASIALYSAKDSALISGAVTAVDGTFSVKPLKYGQYYAVINFIGFQKQTIKNIQISPNKKLYDIGNIRLSSGGHSLQEVTVTAAQSQVQYKLDKKVVNVGQDINSRNGTAIEALQNIPSVNVDVDGNLTLRGSSSFTVLIDGRPSVLSGSDALKQIPATSIENIEVITNPSAKYDPSGVAGIINVILKKNVNLGLTGIVNASVGTRDKYRSDVSLNYNKGKFNYILSVNFSDMKRYSTFDSYRESTITNPAQILTSNGTRNPRFKSNTFRGGFDYKMTQKDVISFLAGIGNFNFHPTSNSLDSTYFSPASYQKIASNSSSMDGKMNFYNLNLNWQHKFDDKGHELSALLYFAKRDGDISNIQNETILNPSEVPENVTNQNTTSVESVPSNEYRVKIDYTLPLEGGKKFEAGIQSQIKTEDDNYTFNQLDQAGKLPVETLNSLAKYTEDIHAVYATFEGKLSKIQYQLGLRGEYNYRKIAQAEASKTTTIDRFDLFPTIHLSEDITPTIQTLASYTRRVQRPEDHDLNPFPMYMDPNNIRQGNPALKPEFVDSYELSVIKKMKSSFISFETYYRVNHDLITRVMTPKENSNIFINSMENMNESYSLGAELMASMDLTKWLKSTLTADVFNYKLKGTLISNAVDKNSTNYNLRLNMSAQVEKTTKFQINGFYRGPSVTAQGTSKEMFGLDMAVQKDLLNRRLSAVLQVQNVLGSMNRSFTATGTNFISESNHYMEKRTLTLTISYKINNYKPEKKKAEEPSLENQYIN